MTHSKKLSALALLGVIGIGGSVSHAALIETDGTNGTGYTVSSTDLIEGVAPSGTGTDPSVGVEGTSTSALTLVNGVFGSLGVTGAPGTDAYAIGNGTVLTFALPASAHGYDISNINTYSGWGDNGRVQQDYTVSYSTVSAPAVFIPITSVAYHPGSLGTPQAAEVLLSDSTGTLASNVAAIQFSFPSTQNGYVGYHELDVIGAASVPEPASLGLLGMGALGLIARRRKA